jgi:ABC-2 type transport system ATP-binding protein
MAFTEVGGERRSAGTSVEEAQRAARDRPPVITVRGLHKSYGSVKAVRGLDVTVYEGEIFAFVGPNGAGKTTTVEILEGYRHRDAGDVAVLGCDPAHPTTAWRSRIGLVLQTCRMPPDLTVRELVDRYAAYYPHPRNVDDTIEQVGLSEKRATRAGKLSGGQERRLDVALALIGDPDLVFLDEPTTGFDPAARHQAWDMIKGLRDLGKTVLLTTHFMDEASILADRVVVIAAGRIIAEGTPDTLGGRARGSEIRFELPQGIGIGDLPGAVTGELTARGNDQFVIATTHPLPALAALTSWAMNRGMDLPGLEVRRPSLEEIYLKLVEEAGQ